jgi:hypothetical protein
MKNKWFKWASTFWSKVKDLFGSDKMKSEYDKLYDAFKSGLSPEELRLMKQKELEDSFVTENETHKTLGYGFKYDFSPGEAFVDGVILPPSPKNPGVFELKNPNQNIKGVVR